MIKITIKSNAPAVAAKLKTLARAMGGRNAPPEAVKIIGREGLRLIRRHFQDSRDPEGRTWKKLKYPRPRGGNKPLLSSGTLRDSIRHVPSVTGGRFVTDDIRAAIHNYGGTTKARTIRPRRRGGVLAFRWKGQLRFFRSVEHPGSVIPKREFMGLGRAEQKEIAAELGHWLDRRIAASGLTGRGRG